MPERRGANTGNIPPGLEPRATQPLPPPPQQVRPNGYPSPDFSKLPPNIAESLAKLAGRGAVGPRGGDAPSPPAAPDSGATGGKPPHGR